MMLAGWAAVPTNWRRPDIRRPSGIQMAEMNDQDLEATQRAVQLLETGSLAARLANILGKPIELIGLALPEGASKVIAAATTKGLNAALKVALRTMENRPEAASRLLHKALATASGAIGGSLRLVA